MAHPGMGPDGPSSDSEEGGGEYSIGIEDATQSYSGPLGLGGYGAEEANQAGDVTASMSVDAIPDPKSDSGFSFNYTEGDLLFDLGLGFLTAGLGTALRHGIGGAATVGKALTGFTDPGPNNPSLVSLGPGGITSDVFGGSKPTGGEELGSGQSTPSGPSFASADISMVDDPSEVGVSSQTSFGFGPGPFGQEGSPDEYIPRRVAEGGGMVNLRNQANRLAAQGRGGDTMLMHMRPDEVAGLASLGGVTRNPVTGLPEGFLLPALGAAFAPGFLGTALGGGVLGTALATGLGAGGGQALQSLALGEDDPLKKGLTAGLTAGIGSAALGGLSQAIGGTPDRIVSGSQTFGPRESIDTLADAQGLDPKAFTRKFDPLTGIDTTTSLTGVSGIDSALSKGLGGLRKGAQKVTGSMLNNPLSTGATLGGLGGSVAEAASIPQYSGPMPGEGTSRGSYRDSGETFQGSPLTRTGLAQQDLSQYGFGPEGMFFGEGVYAQEGGSLEEESVMAEGMASLPSGGGDEVALKLTQEAVDAVRGEHPEPEIAIESFISYFGPEAFNSLRTLVIQEETARNMNGPDGLIEGDDGGRDDIQRGVIDDGVSQEELNLSGGEYIFSADDVALMGDGNTEAGARRLDKARSNLRQKARGTTQRPAYMGEGAAEEIFEEVMVG
jgi:hypothetical protein